MDKQFDLIAMMEAIQKRFKPIVIITLIVLIGAYAVTHPRLQILPLKYESHTMIIPANLALSDIPYLSEPSSAIDLQVDQFGDKHDVDRLVSIALSGQVLAELVGKFNLIEHYEINKEKVKYPMTAAIGKLKDNYKAFKNEYEGAEIWVTDKDKEKAAAMANEAVAITDRINRGMLLDGRKIRMGIIEKHTEAKQKELDDLSARIGQASESEKKLLEIKQVIAMEQLAKYSNLLDQYRIVTAQDLSTVHVMEKAYPAEREKSSRWMLIIGATLFTLFVLVLFSTIIHVMSK